MKFIALLFGVGLCTPLVNAQWLRANLPIPYNSEFYLDIMFLESDPNYGWACSFEGSVVRTTDGGDTWWGVFVAAVNPGPSLEHIQFLNPRVGYVSGPAGIFRSTDGGANWRNISPSLSTNDQSWGCYFINENEGVFLIGGCAGVQWFYKTTNGGTSWTFSRGFEPASGLSDAIIYPDGIGYAVSSGIIWITNDFGSNWQIYSSSGLKYWNEELAISGRTFLVPRAGETCTGGTATTGGMRISTDNGRTFRETPVNAAMFGSFLLNEREGWAVGSNAAAWATTDAGQTWELKNCGITGDLDDVYFINDTLGWITGEGLWKSNFNGIRRALTLSPANDTLEICDGDSVYVEAVEQFTEYRWVDGAVGQGRFITAPGEYVITAFDEVTCLTSADTVVVVRKPSVEPQLQSARTTICEGDSIVIRLRGTFVSRLWNNGTTADTLVVYEGGTYTVETLDSLGCTKRASVAIVVNPNPRPEITANRKLTICIDEEVELSAPPGYEQYLWSTGATSQKIVVNTAGEYTVTVVDSNGCVGTSPGVTVVVLDIRNKVSIDLSATSGVVEVPWHGVGERSCIDIRISNVNDTSNLLVDDPYFLGNVFCSVPQSQLPILIPPRSTRVLQVCCAAIDSGMVHDTIVIPDTCSPTILPVRSRGNTILYEGGSRCEVPTITTVYRAGSAHHLSAPFPNPVSDILELQMSPAAPVSTMIINSIGDVVARGTTVSEETFVRLQVVTSSLAPGPYMVVVQVEGAPVKSFPVTILR